MKKFAAVLALASVVAGLASCGSSNNNNSGSKGSPAVQLSASSLTFTSQNTGTTSSAQTVTLTNSGTAALTITGVSVTGTDSSDFAQTNTCSSSVAAGASCTISVTFTPAASGSATATISLADNASNSPQSITLTGTGAVAALTLSGTAVKSAVNGATVTVYEINADGTNGTVIGTGTTDSSGNFAVALTSVPTGPVRLVITGGTYTSEFSGNSVTSSSSISMILDSASDSTSGLSVTAGSSFVDSLASGLLKSGKASDIKTAHSGAEKVITSYFGFPSGTNLETLVPDFSSSGLATNPTAVAFGLIVGTLTEEGQVMNPSDPDALIGALASDISDGSWDGKNNGTPIPLGGGNLSSTAGTSDFAAGLGKYIASGASPTTNGLTSSNTSDLVTTIETGVDTCSCTPAAVGLAATSSGAINSLAFGGHQYLFVAARASGIAVVDITDPTIAKPPVKVWPQIYTNAVGSGGFGSVEVGGVAPFVGTAGHPQVLAYAYGSNHVIVLNANTLATGTPGTDNPVDSEMDVPLTNPEVSFSGGSAYIGSAVPLGGPLLGLATSDGYMVFDASQVPNASAVVKLYPVDDANEEIAENLGDDLADNLLLGGNEDGGVQLVDLSAGVTAGKSYYVSPTDFTTVFPGPSYGDVDGNSADPVYHVGILTFEDTSDAEFVNLSGIQKTTATTSGTLNSWTPPATNGVAYVNFSPNYAVTISGSAVDPTTHLVMFMAGYSDDIAVGQLQDPASVASGSTWQGLTDFSFFTINNAASLVNYAYATDPHADGVVYNLAKGTPYGYVLDGSDNPTGVVQIDLAGFLAIPRAGTTGDAAHEPSTDPTQVTNTSTGGKVMQEDLFQ